MWHGERVTLARRTARANVAIHLDTNLLIRTAQADGRATRALARWLDEGETLAVSAVTWFEFVCGPLEEGAVNLVSRIIAGGIIAFDPAQAERAAVLFNAAGRKRASRWDCMIAAAAIETEARLATLNRNDFKPFAVAGLRLATL